MRNDLKKTSKKGFTLVELIVVLVILAILAALLVPSLVGYIDRAKYEAIVAETRQIVVAAQTIYDLDYGADALDTRWAGDEPDALALADIVELAELEVTDGEVSIVGNKVKVTHTDGGITCEYAPAGEDTTASTSYGAAYVVKVDNEIVFVSGDSSNPIAAGWTGSTGG